jgi:multiple sugar transport system permease protein
MSTAIRHVSRRAPSRLPMRSAHVLVWLYALLLAIPMYYLGVTAFKDNIDIFSNPFGVPAHWVADNFSKAFDQASLGHALVSSVLVTVGAEIVTLALAIPAAYALARSTGRASGWVEKLFALGFLIPGFAALVPTVLLAIQLSMWQTRTFLVLFLPATALPLSVILLTQFMRTIPSELEESAMMDGASRLTVLRRIYLPLAMPGVVTVLILNFLTFWNEYLFGLVILGLSPELRTVQVALPTLVSEASTQYGVLAAGTIITLVPVYVVYVVLQRRMEEALIAGAVKS